MVNTLIPSFLKVIILLLVIALGVGFYTLMERKILSYLQLRKGPNKIGFTGLPQPLADAAKLFTKESIFVAFSMKPAFIGSPMMAVVIMYMLWNIYLSAYGISIFKLGILFFIAVSSLNVYAVLFSGWASNSKYSLLGAIRAIAQTISYEVSMALVLLTVLMLTMTFNLFELHSPQFIWFIFLMPVMAAMWFISCLAETNRAPFDLAEGESELVSGFNIEYGGGEFAFLFIAEYGSILLMSLMTVCLFLSGMSESSGLTSILKLMLMAYLFLWVRGSYPRMRYDTLMSLTWKTFLASSIAILAFILSQW